MYVPREFFPAVLKTEDGRFLADGFAKGTLFNRTLEFRGDFVPLLQYRTRARVVRIQNGYETLKFEGLVYLSSPAMLRLVEVNEWELAQTALETPQELSLSATVIQREASRERGCEARIFSLSYDKLRFTSPETFEEGEILGVKLDAPLSLRGIEVQIRERIAFGQRERTGYRCDILASPEEWRQRLTEYLVQLSHQPPSNDTADA